MCKSIQSAGEYSFSRQCKLSVICASNEVVKVRSFKGKVIQGLWCVLCSACVGAVCVCCVCVVANVCMCVVYCGVS